MINQLSIIVKLRRIGSGGSVGVIEKKYHPETEYDRITKINRSTFRLLLMSYQFDKYYLLTAVLILLHGWAGYVAVGTINATDAFFWFEYLTTLRALPKINTSVFGHRFGLLITTIWTGNGGLFDNFSHLLASMILKMVYYFKKNKMVTYLAVRLDDKELSIPLCHSGLP